MKRFRSDRLKSVRRHPQPASACMANMDDRLTGQWRYDWQGSEHDDRGVMREQDSRKRFQSDRSRKYEKADQPACMADMDGRHTGQS